MSRSRTLRAVVLALAATSVMASGQNAQPTANAVSMSSSTAQTQVSFKFDRVGLPVPKYVLTIHEDGATIYEGEELPQVSGPSAAASPAHPFRSEVKISPATAAHIVEMGRKLDHFNIACASKAKNIADTGTKLLTYTGPDGAGSCTYNYTENKDVQALTDTFEAIAETMDRGRELDHLRRFDRLGLDAAITFLAQEVSEGRALELGTIATSLRSITANPELIQRVRMRASKLLELIPAEGPQNAP